MPTDRDKQLYEEYMRSRCIISTAALLKVTVSAALKALESVCSGNHRKAPPFVKPGQLGRNRQGWREIAGRRVYMRSKWEANYGRYLQFLKTQEIIIDWEHEPKTFWFEGIKRGVCSYLPDYRITWPDQSHSWAEVKGYMDAKSATKLKRMAKYFPEENILVIDGKWFARNSKKLSAVVPEWE